MTLERLMELYRAEQQGKQIMKKTRHHGYFSTFRHISKVRLSECDLKDLVFDESEDESHTYFIKDEEDECGFKLQ